MTSFRLRVALPFQSKCLPEPTLIDGARGPSHRLRAISKEKQYHDDQGPQHKVRRKPTFGFMAKPHRRKPGEAASGTVHCADGQDVDSVHNGQNNDGKTNHNSLKKRDNLASERPRVCRTLCRSARTLLRSPDELQHRRDRQDQPRHDRRGTRGDRHSTERFRE